ncbi:MAG: putative DNA binding domain-containing protein [Ardenticatenaceae bacterium]|nr:putative DNA binding domain-containing protein [Ardenticatenaceae bacterium]MCB9443034.1 putative DNA binding domain-containing protein [Ardenticatenaceae bacterium]
MENPYDQQQILRLIARRSESLKVDYKQEFDLSDSKKKGALIKDILSMANTIDPDDSLEKMGLDPNYGIIVIGADEEGKIYDISANKLDDAKLQNIINEHVEPRINFSYLSFDVSTDEGVKTIGTIIIPPSERPPHRVPRGYKGILQPGACAKRQGTSNFEKISDYELERMFAWRAQFSDLENRLQQDEYQLKQTERERLNYVFVEPNNKILVENARSKLYKDKFLLIHGESGVGKRSIATQLAEELLKEQKALRLLYLSRFVSVSDLSGVDEAVIIIPDIFGYKHLERPDFEAEQKIIEDMLSSNYIIMTSPTDIFDEVLNETRLEEWEIFHDNQLLLDSSLYDDSTKALIIEKHLSWAQKNNKIRDNQINFFSFDANSESGKEMQLALKKLRLPAQIRRLVDYELPKIKTKKQLLTILSKQTTLENEVYSWFVNANEDIQCFLMVLAIFNDLPLIEFQRWYQVIVSKLRRFNPILKVLPFGTAINNSSPFVVELHGRPSFADRSIQDAVLTVIAKAYHTYFAQLIDDFIDASVPKQTSKLEIVNTELVRKAVTIAASQIAKVDFTELLPLITALANIKRGAGSVRSAEILSSAAQNRTQIKPILELLREWLRNENNEFMYRRWTSVVTLGKMSDSVSWQAINILTICTNKERNPYVRSAIPHSIKPYVSSNPQKSKLILSKLAADKQPFTRRRVSQVVKELSYRKEEFAIDLLQIWATSESERRLWTLLRTCIIIPRKLKEYRLSIITNSLYTNHDILQNSFVDSIKEGDIQPKQGWTLLYELINYNAENANRINALAIILEHEAPEYSWRQIQEWVDSEKMDIRISAAHILSHWKLTSPEKAQPLLLSLSSDFNMEVSLAAQLKPFVSVPESLFQKEEEDFMEDEELVNEDNIDEEQIDEEKIILQIYEQKTNFQTGILG